MYVLSTRDSGLDIYVGEADPLRDRLNSHYAGRGTALEWTRCVAFVSQSVHLNKAMIRFLEARLVELGRQAKRAKLHNLTLPNAGTLSPALTAEASGFLDAMLPFFPLLNIDAFEVPDTTSAMRRASPRLQLLLATARFNVTLRPAHDLIAIHKRNPGQGRRVADLSLNKGVVVFCVAAWQAYVQDLAETILQSLAPPRADPTTGVYALMAGRVREQIRRFNTPNANNTADLLSLVGFDPSAYWSFMFAWEHQASKRYGSVVRSETLTRSGVRKELDAWLLIRHRIAHGDRLPADSDRVSGTDNGQPQMMRRNAQRCIAFFEALVMATDASARIAFP